MAEVANKITTFCIKGEVWPTQLFKSYLSGDGDPVTENSVHFICPAEHSFTLKQAVKAGIFSEEQSKRILATARETQERRKEEIKKPFKYDEGFFLPNNEVVALNLPCVKCGKRPAQRKGDEVVFCLKCYADWCNYVRLGPLHSTWGKPSELAWKTVLDMFLKDMPAPTADELKKLIEECRKKARGISRRKRTH